MSQRFFWIGIAFEIGLAAAGLLLGWLFGVWSVAELIPGDSSAPSIWGWQGIGGWAAGIGLGLLATIPMVVAGYLAYIKTPPALTRLRQTADDLLGPLFGNMPLYQLALLSLAAGFGEEVFFRGFLQQGITTWIGGPFGITLGLIISSAVFGVMHWLHASYAAIAGLLGIYLGLLLLIGDGLIAPIVSHAVYDFAALVFLKNRFQSSQNGEAFAPESKEVAVPMPEHPGGEGGEEARPKIVDTQED